jgi:hypothetical protein
VELCQVGPATDSCCSFTQAVILLGVPALAIYLMNFRQVEGMLFSASIGPLNPLLMAGWQP